MRALLVLAALLAFPASASAAFPGQDVLLLSRSADGGAPNGPSRHAAISQDKRFSRLAAFESEATNIVPGSGASTNVFVVSRESGFGENGSPWKYGRAELASVGIGGAPANGPSTSPSLDGTSREAPHCVAFVSAASNLVPNDTNGTPDAFVRDLRTNRTTRVSVDSRGRQSAGTVTEVQVNGLCNRVAFVSDATDLALRKTRNRSWKSAVTKANPAGVRQVYLRSLGGDTHLDEALEGLTFLASATDGGTPGNADSHDIAFATNSRALTWASEASNLTGADGDNVTDVYQRVMTRRYGKRVHGRSPQYLAMDTRLLSDERGPATQPASNVDGTVVAYTVVRGGVTQVMQHEVSKGATRIVSRTAGGDPGNGASSAPTLTSGGSWVIFQSAASNVATTSGKPDTNGLQDIVLFAQISGDRWLVGDASARGQGASDPMSSPHGNYIVFSRANQVYLDYVGEK